MGFQLNRGIYAQDLFELLKVKFDFPINSLITNISPYVSANQNSLTFLTAETDYKKMCGICFSKENDPDNGFVLVDNPRDLFAQALLVLKSENLISDVHPHFISPKAIISPTASIDFGVQIADDVVIEDFVSVKSGTIIGEGTLIRSFTCVGSEGFGIAKSADGNNIRFLHLGGVKIGKYCEIGLFNSINCGTLSDTIIGDYVKTDAHVHIAHNCTIGNNSILTAAAVLSGGVSIGDNVWLGPNSSIIQKTSIGSDSLIGIGAVVTKNIDSNVIAAGNPSKILRSNK